MKSIYKSFLIVLAISPLIPVSISNAETAAEKDARVTEAGRRSMLESMGLENPSTTSSKSSSGDQSSSGSHYNAPPPVNAPPVYNQEERTQQNINNQNFERQQRQNAYDYKQQTR